MMPPLRPIGQIEITARTYQPTRHLRDADTQINSAVLCNTAPKTLHFPPTASADALADWMADNEVGVISEHLICNRKIGGRWAGRYRLILGI